MDGIRSVLERAADGEGSLLVIAGAPGTGKTELLHETRLHAESLGMRCLGAYGAHAERRYPFAVVRQVFAPLFPSVAGRWPSRARDGTEWLDGPPTSPKLRGLHRSMVSAARDTPLAILVDDAQWADPQSLALVAYLMRRLESAPVAIVLGARCVDGALERGLLGAIHADPLAATVTSGALSAAAVATLVRLAAPWAGAELVSACYEITAGVARLVCQTADALAAEGADRETLEPGALLPLAIRAIRSTVDGELAALGAEPRRVARALAVLSERCDLAEVAAVAALDAVSAAEAIDVLAEAAIVRTDPLEFVQPLVRSAVEASLPMGEAVRAHGRAATSLRGRDASDPRLPRHLEASAPAGDAQVARILHAAGQARLAEGQFADAARLFQRALDEPPPPLDTPVLLTELGIAEMHAGEPAGLERIKLGLGSSEEPVAIAKSAVDAGRTLALAGRGYAIADVIEGAIADTEVDDPELADALEIELMAIEFEDVAHCRRARAILSRLIRPPPRIGERHVAAIARALEIAELGPDRDAACDYSRNHAAAGLYTVRDWRVPALAAQCLMWCGELDSARSFWTDAIDVSSARESRLLQAFARASRAAVALRLGDLPAAEHDARESLAALDPGAWGYDAATRPLAVLLDVLLESGDDDEASRLLPDALRFHPLPTRWAYSQLLGSRARLALRERRPDEALDDLWELARRLRGWGVHNPEVIGWRPQAVQALVALGDGARARALAEDELAAARALGTRRAVGIALVARARVESGRAAVERLAEAARLLEGSPARLDHARALTDHGTALRREGRPDAARPILLHALEAAERCGAGHLTERARAELVLAGGRLRRGTAVGPDALTSTQRRVADLAATGMTNRLIAGDLAVTAKTVETHLTRVFKKLGIDSRTQLAEALSAPVSAGPPAKDDE